MPGQSRGSDGKFARKDGAPSRPPSFGRRVAAGEVTAMVASSARIDLHDKRAVQDTRRRRQDWQSTAWDYVSEIGELGYVFSLMGNLVSKARLFVATRPDSEEAPIPVDDSASGVDPATAKLAIDILDRLRAPEGGQSALMRSAAINLEVTGEYYLHGSEDPETGEEEWAVRSVDELVITGDTFALRSAPGSRATDVIPADDFIIRLWESDPRFSGLATCPMRRVLGECESLLLLSREIRSNSKSRASNGLLLLPSELSFGPADPTRDSADGESLDDPFDAEFQEALITPIQEEGSAASVVPIIIRGQAEFLNAIRHLTLDKPLDAVLDARIEARILRIARGLNLPVETTTGLMSTTFANAIQVERSKYEDHVQPRLMLIADGWTSGYLQPALVAAGVDTAMARDIFVWFDATELIARSDQAEQAEKAHQDGIISDAARRKYVGFTEADAPTDAEILRRLMLRASRMDPTIYGQLLKRSGLFPDAYIPASPGGLIVDDGQPAPIIVGGPNATAETSEVGGPADELAAPPPPRPVMPPPVALPPAPTDPNAPAPQPGDPVPAKPAPPATSAPVTAAGVRKGDWAGLGARLQQIDKRLRDRVQVALDQAMRGTLERAGSRIRSKTQREKGGSKSSLRSVADSVPNRLVASTLGPSLVAAAGLTDAELVADGFDRVIDDCVGWMASAQQAATRAVEAVSGPLDPSVVAELAAKRAAGLVSARQWLSETLPTMAVRRLYDVAPGAEPLGESDPSMTVSMSVARAVCGLAGGSKPRGGQIPIDAGAMTADAWVDVGPLVSVDGGPMDGPGTGADTMDAVASVDAQVEAYLWIYGSPEHPFPPHEALDGVTFEDWESDAIANSDGWPSDYAWPGDHDGCQCDVSPVMIGPSDSGDLLDTVTVDTGGLLDEGQSSDGSDG